MSRLPYLVTAVGGIRPLELTREEIIDVRNALGKTPSDFLMLGYRFALNSFVDHSRQLVDSTPRRVMARLKKVLNAICELAPALNELRTSDKLFVARFLPHDPHSIDRPLVTDLLESPGDQVAEAVRLAIAELERMETRGAMPAYPAICLSTDICSLFFLEQGKLPPLTRGGAFDRVLRAALDAGAKRLENYKSRRDTMELMRAGKAKFDHHKAELFRQIILKQY